MFASRRNILQQNQIKLWGVIWGQCSPALQTETKGNDDFIVESTKYYCVWLPQKLKLAAAGIDRSVSPYQALVNSLTFFHTLRQQCDESIENYRRRFESAWNSAVMNHASVSQHPAFVKFALENDKSSADAQSVEDKLAATYFITFADQSRYQGLWESLSNATLLGRDDYPLNITAAYDLLSHYRGARRGNNHDGPVHVSFAQINETLPPLADTNGETLPDISCWKCMRLGHLSRHCPDLVKVQNVQLRYIQLTHTPSDIVPVTWLLLDSGSTISSICNPDLVQDLFSVKEPVRVFTNGGSQDYLQRGRLKLFDFPVYFNDASMANILSLSEVAAAYRITMDTSTSPSIPVHLNEDTQLIFTQCGSGLYYYDTTEDKFKPKVSNYSFLSTVSSNKEYFTRREIEQADAARLLQAQIGWPSTDQFKHIVNNNLLINCEITADDISRAEAIYGPSVPLLQGKMARRRPQHYRHVKRVPLPTMISEHHSSDVLDVDFYM